jgi:hypothetical protein
MNQNVPNSADQGQLNAMMAVANLQRQVKNGANNFYWIAGLSVINSLIYIFGGGITFVVGLGISQIVDGFASGAASSFPGGAVILKGIGLIINLCIAGIFVGFRIYAAKGQRWAFITGMILYALDAILVIAFGDFFGFAFHLLFLWLLFTGLRALGKLSKVVPQTVSDISFPQNTNF